jgi:hypothetical protein
MRIGGGRLNSIATGAGLHQALLVALLAGPTSCNCIALLRAYRSRNHLLTASWRQEFSSSIQHSRFEEAPLRL